MVSPMKLIRDADLDATNIICVLKDSYGAFVYWNTALEKNFDLPIGGMLGKTEYHLMPDDDAATIRHNDQQVLLSGDELSAVEFTTHSDGSKHAWLVKKFRVVEHRKKFLGVVAVRVCEKKESFEPELAAAESAIHPHVEDLKMRLKGIAKQIVLQKHH